MAVLCCPECLSKLDFVRALSVGQTVCCPKCGRSFLVEEDREPEVDSASTIDESDPRNPLPKVGWPRIALAGVVIILALFGLIHGSTNLLLVAAAIVFGLCCLGWGLKLLLQPLWWPPKAPAGILGHYENVMPLLENLPNDNSYLGTYQLPRGLFQLLTRLVRPQLNYLTPPIQAISELTGTWSLTVLISVLFGVGLALGGFIPAALVLVLAAFAALCVNLAAIHICNPSVPKMPHVEIMKLPTLTRVGNPKGLVHLVVERELPKLRDGDRNKRFDHQAHDTGIQQRLTEFDSVISMESMPRTVPLPGDLSLASSILDWAGAGFVSVGCAILLLLPPTVNVLATKLMGLSPVIFGLVLMSYAFKLRLTFRFRSDLIGIRTKGTLHSQTAGGEGAGFGAIERFHSELYVTIFATRVVSECTQAGAVASVLGASPDSLLRRIKSALTSPRYMLEATLDDGLHKKVQSLALSIQDYRDTHGEVMGADENSEGARQAIESKTARSRFITV